MIVQKHSELPSAAGCIVWIYRKEILILPRKCGALLNGSKNICPNREKEATQKHAQSQEVYSHTQVSF